MKQISTSSLIREIYMYDEMLINLDLKEKKSSIRIK